MAKSTVRKQLLLKSAITFGMAAFAAMPNVASAADVTLTDASTTALVGGTDFNSGEQVEVLAGANDGNRGDLAVANASAIDVNGETGVDVYVETVTGKGISSTGAAISTILVDSGSLNTLVVEAGTVSGQSTSANGGQAVVNLSGAAASTAITTGTNGIITNTAGGTTILVDGANDIDLTVTNAGQINGSGASAIGINVSGGAGSSLVLGNTGTITVTGGTAINVDAGNSATISSNSGTITGNITGNGSGAVTITSNTGTITGNVTTASGALAVTQSGSGKITGNVSSTSGDTDVTLGGTSQITGNLGLGSNASSTAALNGTSNVGGNVTLGNAGQTLTLNGGTVTGTITGTGNVAVNQDYTLTDTLNITGTTTVAAGKTLNADTNNENITATSVALAGAGSTLTIGGGTFTSAVTATVNGQGIFNINDDVTLGGAVGTTGNRLAQLNINNSGTVVAGGANDIFANAIVLGSETALSTTSGDITATTVSVGTDGALTLGAGTLTAATTLGSSADLSLGAGGYVGTIDGSSAGNGNVTFTASQTTGGVIGATRVATVAVNDGVTLTADHNITATDVTVGGGASGAITVNSGKTLTASNLITVNTGGTLTVNGNVNGAIDGGAANAGTVVYGNTQSTTGTVGSTNGLAAVTINNGATLTGANSIKATNVNVGNGAGGAEGLTQTAGTITATNINVESDGTFTLSGTGDFTGTVDGNNAAEGAVVIDRDFTTTNTKVLGGTDGLASVTVATGRTLTVGNNIKATSLAVNGTGILDLGNTARTITGSVTLADAGASKLDLGTADHSITGNLTLGAGDTLIVGVNGNVPGGSGSVAVAGNAISAAGGKLNVELAQNSGRIDAGSYTIIDGAGGGSALNAITAGNISVNGGTNSTGILTFTTSTANAGQDLLLTVTRTGFADITTTENADSVGAALDAIGNANADYDELTTVLTALDNSNTSGQVQAILDQLTPQADNAITEGTYKVTGQSLNIVQSRMEQIRRGNNGTASGETVGDRGVWTEVFGSTAEQNGSNGSNGYDADTYGISIGGDKQINNRTRVGISASYANTEIDSKGLNKTTDADTYQVNVYGTKEFGKFYADGTLGFAWNEYESERNISVVPSTARAEFDGQTYLARIGGGYKHVFNNGVDVTPNLYLTYAHLETSDYSEKGAGALNLDVDNDSIDVLEPRVGVTVGKTFARTNMKVRPELRASYGYDLIGDNQVTTSRFTGTGPSFKTSGADVEKGSLAVGGGIDLISKNNLTVSADYDYETKSDYDSHTGLLRVRYDF